MYHCPYCHHDYLLALDPCPGCGELQIKRQKANRAKERRQNYDPIGRIDDQEFWMTLRWYDHCPCCGTSWGQEAIAKDHIIPLSKEGPNLAENLQPLCIPCNLWKSDHLIYFDHAFPGRACALPSALWPYLEGFSKVAKSSLSSPQTSLLSMEDSEPRYPNTMPATLEERTVKLTLDAIQIQSRASAAYLKDQTNLPQ
jgi:5-methylcytosine-specific restriction endonuclease McrA